MPHISIRRIPVHLKLPIYKGHNALLPTTFSPAFKPWITTFGH